MIDNLFLKTDAWVIALVEFLLMILFIYLGTKFAGKKEIGEKQNESNTILIAAVYSLLGLLLAFTFGMAGSRFDSRIEDVVEESNAIGTAILRSDMYPDSIRTLFREDFKGYLETRISYFEARADIAKVMESLNSSDIYSTKLWERASKLSMNPTYSAASFQMIPALNAMFDIANTRLHGELYKVPDSIMLMLLAFLLIGCLVYGYSSKETSKNTDRYLAICFCLISVLLIYFILDLDRPRRGLINLDNSNQAIVSLRKMFE